MKVAGPEGAGASDRFHNFGRSGGQGPGTCAPLAPEPIDYTSPWAIMDLATLRNPAMLAPATRLPFWP
jgi:hypothetical protein